VVRISTTIFVISKSKKNMQTVKIIASINDAPKVEIEGYGTTNQINVADKLYELGIIDWKTRMQSNRIALSEQLVSDAINTYNLYPRQF
jgi:hypothetical protein